MIRYADFQLNENLQKAKKILRDLKIPETDPNFIKLKQLLHQNTGYMGKFTEWMFHNKVSYENLENLYLKIRGTRLSKSIDKYKSPEEIIDSIVRGGSEAAVNQMIGAIPSRTREFLREKECDECDGGQTDCDVRGCHRGRIECDKCDGDKKFYETPTSRKSIPCDKCVELVQGRRSKGVLPEPTYKPTGSIPCKKCTKGFMKCTYCNGTGKITNEEWVEFKSFLSLHQDDKEIIIDFLSKKGGRYGDDEYDGDEETPVKALIADITKLLNMPSIEEIKNRALKESESSDPKVVYLYDDDKYLLIAVNYLGIREYGSSYWCIYEDEYTFDSYVRDDQNMQCILYIKDKKPLVDEKSIMGITMDYNKEIEAAHWEDDSECVKIARDILKGITYNNNRKNRKETPLPISMKNILKAYTTLYDYEESDLNRLTFEVPEIYIDKINGSTTEFDLSELMKSYIVYVGDHELDDVTGSGFYKQIKGELIKRKLRVPIELVDVIIYDLSEVCYFRKEWLRYDLGEYIEDDCSLYIDGDQDIFIKMFKFFKENGYNIKDNIDSSNKELVELLVSHGLLSFTDYYKDVELSEISDKNLKWLIENDFEYTTRYNYIFEKTIKYLTSKNLIPKYKEELLNRIQRRGFSNSMCEIIVDEVDDAEISIAAARQILPPRLLRKFKFEISKLEHLQKFKEFTIYKS